MKFVRSTRISRKTRGPGASRLLDLLPDESNIGLWYGDNEAEVTHLQTYKFWSKFNLRQNFAEIVKFGIKRKLYEECRFENINIGNFLQSAPNDPQNMNLKNYGGRSEKYLTCAVLYHHECQIFICFVV